MIRRFALALLASALTLWAAPAVAQDDLSRQLINSCIGCRLPKDLHGRDLHGLHFVGSDLRDVDFTHADLSGAEFTGADLDGTRFDDANLRNARFVGVRLRRTSFTRANTEGAQFVGVDVSQGVVDGTLGRVILRNCTGCSLRDLDLHDADLRGIKVVGANLRGAKLAGARLNDASLVGVGARDADFSRADLRGANLVGASLRDARLSGATIGDAVLCSDNQSRYDGRWERRTACADLRGVDLRGVDLRAARYCSTDERDGGYRNCRTVTRQELTELAHADLTGAQAPA